MLDKKRIYNIFEYICAILIVLQCQSVFVNTEKLVTVSISIPSIIFIFALFVFIVLKDGVDKIYSDKRLMLFYIVGGVILLIFLFVEYFFVFKFKINPLIPFFLSIFFLTTYFYISFKKEFSENGLIRKIVNVITTLSIFSIIFFVLYFMGFQTNVALVNHWGTGAPMFNGYFYLDFIPQVLPGTDIIRNSSVFAEPSIFGFVLVTALLMQIFILKLNRKRDYAKLCVFFTAVMTTTSSTSIAIAVLIGVSLVVKILWENDKKKILSIVGIPMAAIGILISFLLYSSKASKSIDIHSSYAVRANDVHACLHAWMDHLFFGVGIGNNNYIGQYMYSYRTTTGFGLSMGLFSVLAYGGLILLLIYLIPCILTIFKSYNLFVVAVFLNIYLVYAMIQETYLFAVFLGYFWAYILSEKTGGINVELFSSRIRTLWSHLRLRSSKEG